jgi:hypothetical protein
MLRSSTGSRVASIFSLFAFGLLPLPSTSTRAQAADQREDGVKAATSGKPQPWDWKELRAAAMLHTEAWYLARAEGARDEAARHSVQAERLLGAVTSLEPAAALFRGALVPDAARAAARRPPRC